VVAQALAWRAGGEETMPVAASAIYFLNLRGDVLINRLYRDDVGCVLPFPPPRLWCPGYGALDLRP
jgi:hypothetical protein